MRGEDLCTRVEIRDHEEYIELLEAVWPFTRYIALIQIDGYDPADPVVKQADYCMESAGRYKTHSWPGTETSGNRAQVHMYKRHVDFYKYLRKFSSFFFNTEDEWGEWTVEKTEFGLDDIVFMDQNQDILMFTTTHEGDIYILEDLV